MKCKRDSMVTEIGESTIYNGERTLKRLSCLAKQGIIIILKKKQEVILSGGGEDCAIHYHSVLMWSNIYNNILFK